MPHKYIDVYPENLRNDEHPSGFIEFERANFGRLLEFGLDDVFRLFYPTEVAYTWWSLRMNKRDSNRGWRLDYFLSSKQITNAITATDIHNYVFGSDHCPISIDIDISKINKLTKTQKEDIHLSAKWDSLNWVLLELELFKMQQELSSAVINQEYIQARISQDKITNSFCAKALAIQKVTNTNSEAGIDGVKWNTNTLKYKAISMLNHENYHCKPFCHIIIQEKKTGKERHINIPTSKDKAMQTLYAFALDPISEATADRKSFAFRKGRSVFDADIYVQQALSVEGDVWVLKADIKSFYDNISHNWIMEHIPINKKTLREFLKAGHIFNGKLFEDDAGISLGSSISHLISNMVLDGMERHIFSCLYKKREIDFNFGNMIRFADDAIVVAKSIEQASEIKQIIEDFLEPRGLSLSEEKTIIVNANTGFNFLGRHYSKNKNRILVVPSIKSIDSFEVRLREKIINHKSSLQDLIKLINKMLQGFANYHRVSDAMSDFRHLDVVVQALLIEKVKLMHPKRAFVQLKEMYWYKMYDGTSVFSDPEKRELYVLSLVNTIFVTHDKVKTSYNHYLDSEYYSFLDKCRVEQKITVAHAGIWNRQNGKCYFCYNDLLPFEKYMIITIPIAIGEIRKIYVHKKCQFNTIEHITLDDVAKRENTFTFLENIKLNKETEPKDTPHGLLREFFRKESRQIFTLKVSEIDIILHFTLEKENISEDFWYDNCVNSISRTWLENGYEIYKLDLAESRIIFKKINHNIANLQIPKALTENKIPKNAKHELDTFFRYIIKKYGL